MSWFTSPAAIGWCRPSGLTSNLDSGVLQFSLTQAWLYANNDKEIELVYQYARPGHAASSLPRKVILRRPLNLPEPIIEDATIENPVEGGVKGYIFASQLESGVTIRIPKDAVIGDDSRYRCTGMVTEARAPLSLILRQTIRACSSSRPQRSRPIWASVWPCITRSIQRRNRAPRKYSIWKSEAWAPVGLPSRSCAHAPLMAGSRSLRYRQKVPVLTWLPGSTWRPDKGYESRPLAC